jgi:hypothetical protein
MRQPVSYSHEGTDHPVASPQYSDRSRLADTPMILRFPSHETGCGP